MPTSYTVSRHRGAQRVQRSAAEDHRPCASCCWSATPTMSPRSPLQPRRSSRAGACRRNPWGWCSASACSACWSGRSCSARVGDRFGRKRAIIGGALAFGVLTVATGFAETYRPVARASLPGGTRPGWRRAECRGPGDGDLTPRALRITSVGIIFAGYSVGGILAGFSAALIIGSYGLAGDVLRRRRHLAAGRAGRSSSACRNRCRFLAETPSRQAEARCWWPPSCGRTSPSRAGTRIAAGRSERPGRARAAWPTCSAACCASPRRCCG